MIQNLGSAALRFRTGLEPIPRSARASGSEQNLVVASNGAAPSFSEAYAAGRPNLSPTPRVIFLEYVLGFLGRSVRHAYTREIVMTISISASGDISAVYMPGSEGEGDPKVKDFSGLDPCTSTNQTVTYLSSTDGDLKVFDPPPGDGDGPGGSTIVVSTGEGSVIVSSGGPEAAATCPEVPGDIGQNLPPPPTLRM